MAEKQDKTISDPYSEAAALGAAAYVGHTGDQIDQAAKAANQAFADVAAQVNNSGVDQAAGRLAEAWHAGSFNVNAAAAGNGEWVEVTNRTDWGSPDLIASWGESFNPKYYASGSESFRAAGEISDIGAGLINKYDGQTLLMPEGQLGDAWLAAERASERAFAHDDATRGALLEDSQARLADHIVSPHGVQSDPLSKFEARELAEQARQGGDAPFMPEMNSHAPGLGDLAEAGAFGVALSLSMNAAPELWQQIQRAHSDPEYRAQDLMQAMSRWLGEHGTTIALHAGQNSLAAATSVSLVQNGVLGASLSGLDSVAAGSLGLLLLDGIRSGLAWQRGEISANAFSDQMLATATRLGISNAAYWVGNTLAPGLGFVAAIAAAVAVQQLKGADLHLFAAQLSTTAHQWSDLAEQSMRSAANMAAAGDAASTSVAHMRAANATASATTAAASATAADAMQAADKLQHSLDALVAALEQFKKSHKE